MGGWVLGWVLLSMPRPFSPWVIVCVCIVPTGTRAADRADAVTSMGRAWTEKRAGEDDRRTGLGSLGCCSGRPSIAGEQLASMLGPGPGRGWLGGHEHKQGRRAGIVPVAAARERETDRRTR